MGGKRLSKEQTEELIELVRRRPYLYDVTDPDHADAGKIANAWLAITEKMGLQDKGYSLKDKWKNLRDHFMKKRREQKGKSGDGTKPKIRWPFYEMLTFLNDHTAECSETVSNIADPEAGSQSRNSDGKAEDQESSFHDFDTQSTIESSVVSDDDTQSENQVEAKSMPKPKPYLKRKRTKHPGDPLDDEIKELIRQRKQDRQELLGMSQMGTNELFFQSCAMRLNKLAPAVQSLVQMQVSQILFQAETSPGGPVSFPAFPPACPQPTPNLSGVNCAGMSAPTQNLACSGATAGTSISDSTDILNSAAKCIFDGYQDL